jgi:hypothetical protein
MANGNLQLHDDHKDFHENASISVHNVISVTE